MNKKHLWLTLAVVGAVLGYALLWWWVSTHSGYLPAIPSWVQPSSRAPTTDWAVLPTGLTGRLAVLTDGTLYAVQDSSVYAYHVATGKSTVVLNLPERNAEPTSLAAWNDWLVVAYQQEALVLERNGEIVQTLNSFADLQNVVTIVNDNQAWLVAIDHRQNQTIIQVWADPANKPISTITLPQAVSVTQAFVANKMLYLAGQTFYPEIAAQSVAATLPWPAPTELVVKDLTTSQDLLGFNRSQLCEFTANEDGFGSHCGDQNKSWPLGTLLFGDNELYWQTTEQDIFDISTGEKVGVLNPESQYCGQVSIWQSAQKKLLPCWQTDGEIYVYGWPAS